MTRSDASAAVPVHVRYWAGARAAAGVDEEEVVAGPRLGDVLDAVVAARPQLVDVLGVCTFLVDGLACGREATVPAGGTLEVLPPFAGG